MKTVEKIIEETRARAASDESLDPPRVALVQYTQKELIKALTPRSSLSKRAAALLAGVSAAGTARSVVVVREHLLVALGAMEEEDDAIGPGAEPPGDVQ